MMTKETALRMAREQGAGAIEWMDWTNPNNGRGLPHVVRSYARWAAHYARLYMELK